MKGENEVKKILNKFPPMLMLAISAFFTALPLVITELGFLQWISVIPTALVLIQSISDRETKLKKMYGRGLIFFWIYYAVVFHWFFYMYPLDFAGLSNAASLVVVFVACLGLSLIQALISAVAFVLIAAISRTKIVGKRPLLTPFVAAAVWVVTEWFQTVGWWGVPWGRLPLGQIDATLLVRSSAIFGSYFVTFTIIAVNFLLAIALMKTDARKLGATLAVALFCINLALGIAVTVSYKDSGETVRVAAAQGNVSSSDKWDADSLDKTMEIYADLTESAADNGAEIVVWPETALPYDLFNNERLYNYVSELAREHQVTILVSAFTKDEESDQLYNSVIEIKPDGNFGETIYSKQRLVPFGEFVPMRELIMFLIPPLANVGMLDEDLLAGKDSTVISTESGDIGCGICFDSIYETLMLNSVRNGAELIAISTNDSWFSDSAALDMHNSQSRLRAIETGRYVVRSANTGISSVIDPLGNVKEELGALKRGYVISNARLKNDITIYTTIGNVFVYMCIAFCVAIVVIHIYQKLRNNKFIKNS
ncbi:MAG: apolipoprotein N-acyltransferase [Ruminococcaceae bacterium]|nr:apolipoprotein N-acyltransferase [Oscillospiraceae bacterium]